MDIQACDKLLRTTRSVRKRLDFAKPVEPKVLEECIDIALQAPTGSNMQGWSVVVVTDEDKKKAIADVYKTGFAGYAAMREQAPPAFDDRDLRAQLEEGCRTLDMPQIGALDPLVGALSRYLGAALSTRVGAQHALDHDYFNRIGALDFAMAHDDGQGTAEQLEGADVVLVGVSRTSKTPTCIYLAHRGVRAANVPLVPGQEDGERLVGLKNPLIVGLTVSPDRLVQIRRNRLDGLNANHASAYVEPDAVREETIKARRAFERRGWPTIDVTRRSVEETAAAVLNLLNERRSRQMGGSW